jgi:hypothetical protein
MQCPVCRAANDQGPTCRRCRADLSLLFDLDEQRHRLLAAARQALVRGQAGAALALAVRASGLRRDEEGRRLMAVCQLLQRHFAQALQAYRASV